MAQSFVQIALTTTTPFELLSLVRQVRTTEDALLSTSVELIAHSLVQVSLNSTAPVSRYSLVRQFEVVVAVVAAETAAVARAVGLAGAAARRYRFSGFVYLSSSSSFCLTPATRCCAGAGL